MASGDREEISSRLGGVTVSRVSPSHSQAVVPPQVIHKSNRRRGTRLPVTHNKEVTNNARNFFFFFLFLFFRHRAPVTRFSSCVFCAFLPLLFPSSPPAGPFYRPAHASLQIAEKLSEKAVCNDLFLFSFFFFFFFSRSRSEVCVGRGILDTSIDKWKRFEEQLNCR